MDNNINPLPTRSGNNKSLIIIAVVIIVAVLTGIYFYTKQPKKTEEKKEAVIESVMPTPTTEPEIDKSTVKIQVINGTGTPGQAGQVVQALKEEGYSADNIETDNAEEFNNTVTTITARANFEKIAENMKDTLKATFDDVKIESTKLEEESKFDVVVVTGGKIFETPTPTVETTVTPSPTPTSTLTPTPTP